MNSLNFARRIGPFLILFWMVPTPALHAQWVVGPEEELTTIQDALDRAAPGDTIRVTRGVYTESDLVLTYPVVLTGDEGAVIDGAGEGSILVIRANEVTIEGLTLRNTGFSHMHDYAAILVDQAEDVRIRNNRLEEVYFGIYLAETRGGQIEQNVIHSQWRSESGSGNGIHLWNADRPVVTGNRVSGQRDGIYLEFVNGAEIRGNHSEGNRRYGLHFMFSDDSRYLDNEFRNNGAGVAVMYSSRVEMRGNRFVENWGGSSYGLLLKDMTESRIEGNRFTRNTTAIFSEGSSKMEIVRNRFELNGYAIKIRSNSRDNHFSDNLFIENTFDVGTDSRRNPNTFEGNYWSHYEGYDLDRDGIGDVPYRPVRLFSMMVERYPQSMILLRSMMVRMLDMAEQVFPVLTPATLIDDSPKMERWND